MPRSASRARRLTRALAVALLGCAATAAPSLAAPPETPFPLRETFRGAAPDATGWRTFGTSAFTGDADRNGWLRLTPATNESFGTTVLDQAFPSDAGIVAEFDFAMHGGTGADGITFFLYDGAIAPEDFTQGAPGGALGYCDGDRGDGTGVSGGYIGVGLDLYGNFTTPAFCGARDGNGLNPDQVVVRGRQAEGFPLKFRTDSPRTLAAGQDAPNRASVVVTPQGRMTLSIRYADGTTSTLVDGLDLGNNPPPTLKLGFAASTGGANNNHDIRDLFVAKPVNLATSVSDGVEGAPRGQQRTWTATVANDGPNDASDAHVSLDAVEPLDGMAWSCAGAGGAVCPFPSGTGQVDLNTGPLPVGGSLTFTVTGTPAAGADHAELSLRANPLGDTGEMLPADNQVVDVTDLTPVPAATQEIAVDHSGRVNRTTPAVRGGRITVTERWLRCEPAGVPCADITGATASSYLLSGDDSGSTIRHRFTYANAAGVVHSVSEPLALPETTKGDGPADVTSDRDASLHFSATTAGAQCRIDGGDWEACASPLEVTGLADGEHVVEIRGNYAVLVDPTPVVFRWTVDTIAPQAPLLLTAPEAATTATVAGFGFAAEPGAELECALDDLPFAPCGSPLELSGLAVGEHRLQVRQTDRAGNRSPVTTHRWTVQAPAVADAPAAPQQPAAPAPAAPATGELVVAAKTVVAAGRVGVGCHVDGAAIDRCTVKVHARIGGKRVLIGTATRRAAAGATRLQLQVRLNAAGRRLLGARVNGLPVTVSMQVTPQGGRPLTSTMRTRLYPRRVDERRVIWPFDSASALVTRSGKATISALASQLGKARRVTCIGHTDARGSAQRNLRLGLQRARAACAALRRAGVKATTAAQSWGEARPRATNATATGRRLNRRVELVVRY